MPISSGPISDAPISGESGFDPTTFLTAEIVLPAHIVQILGGPEAEIEIPAHTVSALSGPGSDVVLPAHTVTFTLAAIYEFITEVDIPDSIVETLPTPSASIVLPVFEVFAAASPGAEIVLPVPEVSMGAIPAIDAGVTEFDIVVDFPLLPHPEMEVEIPAFEIEVWGTPRADIVIPEFFDPQIIEDIEISATEFDIVVEIGTPLGFTQSWVMNLAMGETTRWIAPGFLHFVRMGGQVYGIAADGFYRLGGSETDNGSRINARAHLNATDFGPPDASAPGADHTLHMKRLPYVYVGSHNDIEVTAYVEDNDSPEKIGPYQSQTGNKRVSLARGPKGRYWSLEIKNVRGNRFRIDEVEYLIEILSRKVK